MFEKKLHILLTECIIYNTVRWLVDNLRYEESFAFHEWIEQDF